jgi:hypothetical protein
MTAGSAAVAASPRPAAPEPAPRRPGLASARLLRLELSHNAMLWLLPVVFALFWLTTYRKVASMPPLWNVRAASMQTGTVVDAVTPVVAAAAWMGSREARRHTGDLIAIVARPDWIRLLVSWAATACWAVAGGLACLAAGYLATAHAATWGGPLWWPAAVVVVSLVAMSAVGFALGALIPSRFTAPIAGIASFFVLVLSTELIVGSQSYWQVSPLVSAAWDDAFDPGTATFYPYLPDLSIAQLMFLGGLIIAVLATLAAWRHGGRSLVRTTAAVVALAGLAASGTATALAGTGRLGVHGMIVIPALHDGADDRPLPFTPDCSATAIPVCLNPAYSAYLPGIAAALKPVITEMAGLPGAPARISQVAATYRQGPGNEIAIAMAGPAVSGNPPVDHVLLPDQFDGAPLTPAEMASQVATATGPAMLATFVGDHAGAAASQVAVWAALTEVAGHSRSADLLTGASGASPRRQAVICEGSAAACAVLAGLPASSPAVRAAAGRFAALPVSVRRAWLAGHLAALRAGQITLSELP